MDEFGFPKPKRETAEERQKRRRDRHGWRTAKKTSKWGTPTHAAEKTEARKLEVSVKAETRRKVWARSSVCEYCGLTEDETAKFCHRRAHEQDEVLPRSLTRGRPPEERFSTANTARACSECHRKKTEHQIGIWMSDAQIGMDGDYEVIDRTGTVIRTVKRIGKLE